MDNVLENKIKESLTRGTLLYELARDVLRNSSKYNLAVDIGGRDGSNLALLEVYGVIISSGVVIDISPVKIYEKYDYILKDVTKNFLPLNDSSADLVLVIEVLEHLLDPDHLLSEIKRILSPKGIAIITTPNLAWWPNIFMLATGHQPIFTEVSTRKVYGRRGRNVVGHLRIYTFLSLREMLLDFGFKILKMKAVQTSVVPRWLRPLDRIISSLSPLHGCDIYVVMKK